jgi:hypothetical protein
MGGRSDDNMPPSLFKKEPIARRFAPLLTHNPYPFRDSLRSSQYFGSQFNIFLVASLNHYFSPRVKGITSIVDHKYKYNDAMNSAIFLYPEIKYMVDRVVREDLLPAR